MQIYRSVNSSTLHSDAGVGDFTFYNRNGASVVDYILLNNNDFQFIEYFDILPPNEFSDHCAISFGIHCNRSKNVSLDSVAVTEQFIMWDESRADAFNTRLSEEANVLEQITENLDAESIDQSVTQFMTFMQRHAFSVFGKSRKIPNYRSPNKNRQPWLNAECIQARTSYNRARNLFLRNKTQENKQLFLNRKRAYIAMKRKHKRRYKKREGTRVNNLAKSNPKAFWKNVNKQYKSNTLNSDSLNINNMYEHFKELFCFQEVTTTGNMENNLNQIHDADLDKEFTESELRQAVFSQNNSKSPGTDQLVAEIFKHSFEIISPFLLRFYNLLFSQSSYPKSWTEGIIVPIFKGGNPDLFKIISKSANNLDRKI